jgi:hypothetical protein
MVRSRGAASRRMDATHGLAAILRDARRPAAQLRRSALLRMRGDRRNWRSNFLRPHPEEPRSGVSKDGRNAWTRGHPSRRGLTAAPQDEVGDIFKVLNPHGEERGKAARLEPSGRGWTRGHPSRRGQEAAPLDEVGDLFTGSEDKVAFAARSLNPASLSPHMIARHNISWI